MPSTTNHFQTAQSFYKKEKWDLDSWFQVTQTDYQKLIAQYPFDEILAGLGKSQINLLDIGCGVGKFPSLLDSHISDDIHLSSDLFDVSSSCLQAAQQKFDSLEHFSPNQLYLSEVENIGSIIPKTRIYDLIWSIHSFYTVDKHKMESVFQSCLELLSPDGKFLIYQLSKDSFYHEIYDFYLKYSPAPINNPKPFMTAEDSQKILESLGLNYQTRTISFNHLVNYDQHYVLEVYLKMCVLNHEIDDVLFFFQDLLSKYWDKESHQYKFPQVVKLLVIDNMAI
jgi:cyclopropane fatty-acyl-phospholipid synthase-like methyltransferase